MLTVNKHKEVLLKEFYLDSDDLTIRRVNDGYHGRYKKDDVVTPYKLPGNDDYMYLGIHVPKTRTTVSYHHLLTLLRGLDIPNGSVLDHIDGNTLNNVRSNIRITTQSMNARNSKKPKNNTSGYTGISWNKKAGLYSVRKWLDGVRKYKSSKTLEGAIQLMNEMDEEGRKQGYTERHGQ